MVGGHETFFCWVPTIYSVTMVSLVAFISTYLFTTHKQVVGRKVVTKSLSMYEPYIHLVVVYFPTYLAIYETYFLQN
jgi:hypothetical protein